MEVGYKKTTVFADRYVTILATEEGYVFVDLESANGTFVNLKQIPPKVPYSLQAVDVVHVGQLEAGAPRFVYHGKRCRRF